MSIKIHIPLHTDCCIFLPLCRNAITGVSLHVIWTHVRNHSSSTTPFGPSFCFPCPASHLSLIFKKKIGGGEGERNTFLSRGQNCLHPWAGSVKLLINEPPFMYSTAPGRACVGSSCSSWEQSTALAVAAALGKVWVAQSRLSAPFLVACYYLAWTLCPERMLIVWVWCMFEHLD